MSTDSVIEISENEQELKRALSVLNFYKHRGRSNWRTQEQFKSTIIHAGFIVGDKAINTLVEEDEVISLMQEDSIPLRKDSSFEDFMANMLYMTGFEVVAIAHYYITSYKDKYQDINKVQISEGEDSDGDYTGVFRVSFVDTKVDMTIGYYEIGSKSPLVLNYNATLPAEVILARVESLLHQKAVKLLFGNLASSRPEAK